MSNVFDVKIQIGKSPNKLSAAESIGIQTILEEGLEELEQKLADALSDVVKSEVTTTFSERGEEQTP